MQQVLAIDPEDLQAHYNLMLCYNGLGDEKMANEHQARYLRFKADEASQAITGPYRQLNPEDNNERQSIHEHVSSVPTRSREMHTAGTDWDGRRRSGPPDRALIAGGMAVPPRGEPAADEQRGRCHSKVHRRRHGDSGERARFFISAFLRVSVSPWWVVFAFLVASFAPAQTVTFRDITVQAGIRFTHNNGAFGKKWLPETMGPGCAFIDYDNDGYPDILLVNGTDWPGHAKSGATTPKLYHNNHDGTFTDVTRKSGLGISLYGLGVAVGDYDNDGFDDIFITARRPEPSLPQQRQRHIYGRDQGGRSLGTERVFHQRRLGGLRSRRQARSRRLELRAVV